VLCLYVGGDARGYGDYLNAATSRMLEVEPGANAVYDVIHAPGRNPGLPLPPGDGRWIAISALEPQAEPRDETAAEVAPDDAQDAPEAPEGEPAHEDAPEPEEPAAEPATDPEGAE
jgi:hypothetical protein